MVAPSFRSQGAGGPPADVLLQRDGLVGAAAVDVRNFERAFQYETVAASQTDQVMGATGAVGDYLDKVICVVTTAATAAVSIKDGDGSAIAVLPNSPGGGVGTYVIDLGLRCTATTTPGWKLTTGAGVAAIGVGRFT